MSIKLHFTIPRLGVWWIRTYSEISPTNKKIILDESIDEPLSYNYTVLELWERFNKDKKIDTELWKRLEDVIQYQIRLAKDNLPGAVGYPTGMESPDEARHISTLICIRGVRLAYLEGWEKLYQLFKQATDEESRILLLDALVNYTG